MCVSRRRRQAAVRHASFHELFSIPLKNLLPCFVRLPPRWNRENRPGCEERSESGSRIRERKIHLPGLCSSDRTTGMIPFTLTHSIGSFCHVNDTNDDELSSSVPQKTIDFRTKHATRRPLNATMTSDPKTFFFYPS